MPKKNISSVDVAGKRVLVRVDLNVPISGGVIGDDRRITSSLPTIKSIIERGGKAVLMSHLGRPARTGYEQALSLKPVAERLGQLLGKPVAFPSQDCTDDASANVVANMADGDVVLLENLRFHDGETAGDAGFATKLASLGDIYVNDAFGTCHRPHASMVAVPEAMGGKPRVSGFLVEKEIAFLSDALANPTRPFVVVLGGAKVSDKLGAVERMLDLADHVLVGGAMAYTFLKALGHDIGASRVETDKLSDAKRMIELAAKLRSDLHLPTDHVCGTQFSKTGGDIEVFEESIKDGFMGMDIGPKTQSRYGELISQAKTVVWNGPMGVFEWPPFRIGTSSVARAIANATDAGATSIVGGGDSAAAVETFGVANRMSHVSTGGGASIEMLEGKPFRAVDLLDNA